MAELGKDADWTADASGSTFPWSTTPRAGLVKAVARRLMTPYGSVPFWPRYGFDIRASIGSNMSDARIQMGAEEQVMLEERVEACEVVVNRIGGDVYLYVTIDDGDGPFEFVLSVTDAAVSLVESLQGAANG
jgi:hypothetical protein